MRKTETLTFRVSKEFKRRLREEAQKEHRSVTNYLEITLTQFWERRDATPGGPTEPKRKARC
jgi:predicted transcriptional regulator